jgi:hypothetical protein
MYKGQPARFKRKMGQKTWDAPNIIGIKDVEREMSRLRPTYRDAEPCDFATKVSFLYRKRKDGTKVLSPKVEETCGAGSVVTFYDNGKINRRCEHHAKKRTERTDG